MTGTDESSKSAEQPNTESSGLYHKRDIARRRRPPDYRPTGGARKGPARDLSHVALLSNLRIFIIVASCMFILLLVAVWVARKGMQIRSRPSVNRQAALNNPGFAEKTIEETMPAGTDAADMPQESLFKGSSLDTSAIRKAVFLAKQGKQLAENGDLGGAVDLYHEALAIWPNLVQAWGELGQSYLKLGKYDQAQLALEKAVEQDPANVTMLNDLGVAHLHRGDLNHAEEYFNAAVEINADFPEGYYNRALCHLARKSNDLARVDLEMLLLKSPGDARALKELAYLDALAGKYEAAQKKLDQAIQNSPDWSALYFDAAAAAALQGRVEATFTYLESALDQTSPRITYQVYQRPAFNDMRATEQGKEFEKALAERARNLLNEGDTANEAAGRAGDGLPLDSVSSETGTMPNVKKEH